MHPGSFGRHTPGQGNGPFRGHRKPSKPSRPESSNAGVSCNVIRQPTGSYQRKPFPHRGAHHGAARVVTTLDPFASDEEDSTEITRHVQSRGFANLNSVPIPPPRTIPSLLSLNMGFAGAVPKTSQETRNPHWRGNYRGRGKNVSNSRENQNIYNRHVEGGKGHYKYDDKGIRDNGNADTGERNEKKPRGQKYALGFKKLEEILNGLPEDVLLKLLENSEAFSLLLDKPDLSPDCICLILQAMTKLADSAFDQHKLRMIHTVTKDSFMKQLFLFVTQLHLQDERDKKRSNYFWKNPDGFFLDLHRFCEMVLKMLPTTAINVLPKLPKAVLCIIPYLHLGDDISTLFENLQAKFQETIDDLEKKKQKGEVVNLVEDELEPPDNFRDINVFPQPYEIVTWDSPFLRQNIVEGAYKSIEHYLDVQFRLVRNDFVKPLRDGICTYLNKDRTKKVQNIKIYNGVVFLKAEMCANAENGYLIQLPQKKNKGFQLKLENSRIFMYGSLVCFTKDNFQNISFGRIVERKIELLKEGRLIISMHTNSEQIDFDANYIMIEAKVYFEPYYYVLSALQHINESDFPMKEYIVDLQPGASVPDYYLVNEKQVDGQYRIPIIHGVVYDFYWPTAEKLQLNVAQYAAYKNALSRKFAIIQGPPGTGKTYLGLKVAKALLNNAYVWHKKESPMLVVCFTNHALDQFLEGLLTTTKEIVRIGGQSKNKALDQFNIKHIRNKSHNHLIRNHMFTVKQASHGLKRLYDLLHATRAYDGIVNIKPLLEKLPELNNTWFCSRSNEEFTKWLFGGTVHKNVKELDVTQIFAKNSTDGAAAEDEEALLQEVFDMFDKEDEHNPEDDILDVNYSGASIYMITVRNYEENLERMVKEAEYLKSLGDEADPNEWEKLHNSYNEAAFEHEYLMRALEEGKKIVDPQPPRDMQRYVQKPQNMPPEDRWLLYFYWVKTFEAQILKSIAEAEAEYHKVYREYEDVKMLVDIELLREKLVIGITTTSAARLQSVLRALRSRVVIVEEAAEIMEAHIITALTKHCNHVILIGDHQQLRPSTADYMMETKYKLGISLFERMVRNKVHCNVLEIQHRMRPEISKLIVPTIYPVLHNHESVYGFPSIRGVDRNLYFIDHKNAENIEKDDSKFNMHEVKYLINLAQYLILNGYKPEDVTILCAYSAQLFKMFHERRRYPLLADVRICVLDNYQGEESKIILLSLVRNNKERKIGFLKIDNRICVALSRAREGFYIMGNMDMLTEVSTIWQEINKTLESQDGIGEALPLRCQVHKATVTHIKEIEDFQKVAEGGCDQVCNDLLLCGHTCKMQCHIQNRDHSESRCREKCLRILCEEEHGCSKMCFEDCGPCMFPMRRYLKCGHTNIYPCSDKQPNCREIVAAKLQCGHTVEKQCHVHLEDVRCPHPCDTRIESCGHACILKCHINKDPDHLEYKCRKKCGRIRPNCMLYDDEHRCTKCCYEECDECDIIVKKIRSCSHVYQIKCSESVELMHCGKPCKETLPCGHKCRQECSDPCGNCMIKVQKEVPECGHTIKVLCKETPTKSKCTGPCNVMLACGHQCQNKCKDQCTTECRAMTPSIIPLACGHNADIPCSFNSRGLIATYVSLLKYCKVPCTKVLKCDHNCSGTCGECYQGRIHKVCTSDCGVSLVCGHICKTPCRQVCPPCTQNCEYRCLHSKCKKKCGEPCTPCREKCTRRCQHQACSKMCSEICSIPPCDEPCPRKLKCGHNCIGFCGDPCPLLCKVCNYEELIEEFYMGYEEDEDAKFVLLEDCKHTIESQGMDMWLASQDGEINVKCCPKCKQTLANTKRYSDFTKRSLKNIIDVKNKYYGELEKNVQDGRTCITKLENLYRKTNLKSVCPIVTVLYETFVTQLKPVRNGKRQMLSKLTVEITNAKVQILENICNLYDKVFRVTDKPTVQSLQYVAFLLDRLTTEKERMTEQEVDDYEVELKRLRRLLHFSYVTTRLPGHKILEKPYQDLHKRIFFLGPYDVKEDDNVKRELEQLSRSIGMLDISDSELQQIVKVIGVKSGAWYKCPNGHPYAIGDCGGAMVLSKCPDCGAKIGGQNHALTAGNAHFAIDGSRHAAWSEQANLENYQLD